MYVMILKFSYSCHEKNYTFTLFSIRYIRFSCSYRRGIATIWFGIPFCHLKKKRILENHILPICINYIY